MTADEKEPIKGSIKHTPPPRARRPRGSANPSQWINDPPHRKKSLPLKGNLSEEQKLFPTLTHCQAAQNLTSKHCEKC